MLGLEGLWSDQGSPNGQRTPVLTRSSHRLRPIPAFGAWLPSCRLGRMAGSDLPGLCCTGKPRLVLQTQTRISFSASHAPSLGTRWPGRTPACTLPLPLQPSCRWPHSSHVFSKALALSLSLLCALIPIILGGGEEVEEKRGLELGLFPLS